MITGRERGAPLIIFTYNYKEFLPQLLTVIDTRDMSTSVFRENTEQLKAKRTHKSNKYSTSLRATNINQNELLSVEAVYLGLVTHFVYCFWSFGYVTAPNK